jgi:hypothetical protein
MFWGVFRNNFPMAAQNSRTVTAMTWQRCEPSPLNAQHSTFSGSRCARRNP